MLFKKIYRLNFRSFSKFFLKDKLRKFDKISYLLMDRKIIN